MFAGRVATDERHGFDVRVVAYEVDRIVGAVDHL